jgi:hypothetical protein
LVRLLAACVVEEMTETQARAVGLMAGRSRHDDIVAVTVVEGAVRRGDGVVTSNGSHIELVDQAAGADLPIEAI